MNLVLPQSTVVLIKAVAEKLRHPGLQLDKFSIPGDQTAQKGALTRICSIPGDPALLEALIERRNRLLGALQGASFSSCKTIGPLTLHLARASALENAGICLHPLYGFAYLPGSGVKGMARAYAETVWLAAQTDRKQAWRQIEDVFGWAPNPDRRQQINDPNHPAEVRREDEQHPDSPEIKSSSGNIVIHDAWPESWPQLVVDIVNNHHKDYYSPPDEENEYPPGDWEDPVPVYFLAVKPGATFTFPLSKRRPDVPDELLALARQWLLGALCHLGAGAKTNAGYGAFRAASDAVAMPKLPEQSRATSETTLELVTPAFLAGAKQYGEAAREGCDLRSATLRGHLRWWWRTMHAAFLEVKMLRALEAAIWGDTSQGGAVRITLRCVHEAQRIPVPGKHVAKNKKNQDVLRSDPTFTKANALRGAPQKTTQGLLYLSYGMDEMPAGKLHERKQRICMLPGAKWEIVMIASDAFFQRPGGKVDGTAQRIAARMVCDQAKSALWLLCRFGGVGSKGRNGFGSLIMKESGTLSEVKQAAATLHKDIGISRSSTVPSEVSSLEKMLSTESIQTPWRNYWFVLDQLGFSIQAFCQADSQKRSWVKEALGLPRKIGISDNDGSTDRGYSRKFDKQTKQEVVWLGQKHPYLGDRDPKDMRHASPVHCHIGQNTDGTYSIEVVAFPSGILSDVNTSQNILNKLIAHLKADLIERVKSYSNAGQIPHSGPARRSRAAAPGISSYSSGPDLPKPGDRIEAVLREEKTRKGGWNARHDPSGLTGPIHNSADVPGDRKAGDRLTLIVASVNPREMSYRYPTAADEQRTPKAKRKGKGAQGRRQPRGRT